MSRSLLPSYVPVRQRFRVGGQGGGRGEGGRWQWVEEATHPFITRQQQPPDETVAARVGRTVEEGLTWPVTMATAPGSTTGRHKSKHQGGGGGGGDEKLGEPAMIDSHRSCLRQRCIKPNRNENPMKLDSIGGISRWAAPIATRTIIPTFSFVHAL